MIVTDSVLKNYRVTSSTYLLQSKPLGKRVFTTVYEKNNVYTVTKKPLKLIQEACVFMGSSYKAAIEHSKLILLDSRHKLPVVVANEFQQPITMFPLFSPKSKQNIWVSFNNITNIVNKKHSVLVTFKDEFEFELPVTISSLNNQYVASAILYRAIHKKWNEQTSVI